MGDGRTRVADLSDGDLRDEIEMIAQILMKGPFGSTLAARARGAAVIRECARRMRRRPTPPLPPSPHPAG